MRTLVKICGVSDAATLRAAIDAGADAVGFVFAASPRQVSAAHAAELTEGLPESVTKVAVMLHPSPAEWDEVQTVFQPQVLQTDRTDFERLDIADAILRWPVIREGAAPADDAWPEIFVYEGSASGAGQQVDWTVAARHARRGRMMLAGGLDGNNVTEAIRSVRPFGVDVSSGVEAAPGKKDIAKIRAFIAAVRATELPDEETKQ